MSNPNPNGKKSGRDRAGRFALGDPCSPGRPPGRGAVAEMRETLATDLNKIIDTLRSQGLAGDAQAVRIILDCVLPALPPVELPVELAMPAGGTLARQARAVVQAAADGDLAPGQAAQIVGVLAGVGKIIETTELLSRIEALKAASAAKKGGA